MSDKFTLYSSNHYIPFIVWLVVLALIGFFTYKESRKNRIIIGVIICAIPFITTIWDSVLSYNDSENFAEFVKAGGLPINVCRSTPFVAMFGILTKNRKALAYTYFAGMGSNIMALVSPELFSTFPDLHFILFFITHWGNLLIILYIVHILRYVPTKKDLIFAIIAATVVVLITFGFDYFTNSNYNYLMAKPVTPSLMEPLGPWPYYLLWCELIGIIMFSMFYFVLNLEPKNKKG